jgi:hypothetical protein
MFVLCAVRVTSSKAKRLMAVRVGKRVARSELHLAINDKRQAIKRLLFRL